MLSWLTMAGHIGTIAVLLAVSIYIAAELWRNAGKIAAALGYKGKE